jgi:ribosomal protein S18 acetylase RimI-like enzyme
MRVKYKLRKVQKSDLDWLLTLRMETMAGYVRASGTLLTTENQMARIEQDYASIEIIRFEDQDIGMIKLVKTPDFWKLIQIQILPEFQNCGIGQNLIKNIQHQAGAQGIPIALSVLRTNPAKRLYERLGFQVTLEKEKSYQMSYDV